MRVPAVLGSSAMADGRMAAATRTTPRNRNMTLTLLSRFPTWRQLAVALQHPQALHSHEWPLAQLLPPAQGGPKSLAVAARRAGSGAVFDTALHSAGEQRLRLSRSLASTLSPLARSAVRLCVREVYDQVTT